MDTLAVLTHLGAAFLLALPIAWDRQRSTRLAGLRTFPLVALASCGFVLAGRVALGDHPDAQARILQGLMTGIGFIGGGAILKGKREVRGTATAASIWATGLIGAVAGYALWSIALAVSALTLLVLRAFTRVERRLSSGSPDEDRRSPTGTPA